MYENLLFPVFSRMDAELAHNITAFMLRTGARIPPLSEFVRKRFTVETPRLNQNLFGLRFENPVGLAAGMTKSGRELLGWDMFGFGFHEMGGITFDEQPGNTGKRMFRNVEAKVLFNRMGFNNPGAHKTAEFLSQTRFPRRPLLINIGKSKSAPNEKAAEDYARTFELLYPYGDIFVVNPSSPNTPGLRDLQAKSSLLGILTKLGEVRKRCMEHGLGYRKFLVKLSPDLTRDALMQALEALIEGGGAGVVATNTTTNKLGVACPTSETVGMSGPPLFEVVHKVVQMIRRELPELPIIAVGGIDSGNKMYELLQAGANLFQVLTGLVYEGPSLVPRINVELNGILTLHREFIWSFSPKVTRN